MVDVSRELFICLLSAHVFGDFLLQTARMAQRKNCSWKVFLLHTVSVAALSYVLCGAWSAWQIPLYVLAAHSLIDWIKVRFGSPSLKSLLADQSLHVASLALFCWPVILSRLLPEPDSALFWARAVGPGYSKFMILAAGAVLTIQAGGVLTQAVVAKLEKEVRTQGLPGGGRRIGQLERTLIYLLIVSGNASTIGFLIAAKSILRLGELKDPQHRQEAEYIIIGTLASFTSGIAASLATLWAISSLP